MKPWPRSPRHLKLPLIQTECPHRLQLKVVSVEIQVRKVKPSLASYRPRRTLIRMLKILAKSSRASLLCVTRA